MGHRALETTLTDMPAPETRTRRLEPGDFDWIVRQHQKRIYRVLLLLVRDQDSADTLTQECFLRAFRKHDTFRGESGLATWLVRIAINLAYDHNRSRRWAFWRRMARATGSEMVQVSAAQRSAEQVLLAREQVAAVWSAVERLPRRQKTAFVLRFAEEMSLEEVAKALDLEVGTVKAHLSRAIQAVRETCRRQSGRGSNFVNRAQE
jgi:RNA polymerase sigma-70 factor (ECF subfamily)